MNTGVEAATWFRETLGRVREEVGRVIAGQDDVVEGVLVGLAAGGHVLLEVMPEQAGAADVRFVL